MMQLPLNLEINASQILSEASKPKPSQQPCNAGVIPPTPITDETTEAQCRR